MFLVWNIMPSYATRCQVLFSARFPAPVLFARRLRA